MEDKKRKIIQTITHGSLATTFIGSLLYGGYYFINELSNHASEVMKRAPDRTEGLAIGALTFGLVATIPLIYAVKSASIALENIRELKNENNEYKPISLDDYLWDVLGDD